MEAGEPMTSLKLRAWRSADSLLRRFGWTLASTRGLPRMSTAAALANVRRLGIVPGTVIDVGAAYGDWSAECAAAFPDARYLVVEPLSEYGAFLDDSLRAIVDVHRIAAAASAEEGELVLNVHADLVGTSLHHEHEKGLEIEARTVPAVTVDGIVKACDAVPPYLLKVDVQGAELGVLAGAVETLRATELVVLEVSFLEFFKGGARFDEVVAALAEAGFAAYDLLGVGYRPLDGALSQADLLFVPRGSSLRSDPAFARPEERAAQNERFRAEHERRAGNLTRP
jgi:FkbM family methyltransferase